MLPVMPFTPYHFGPSGFIALAFRKWIDVPVFVLANVVLDIEVLIIKTLGLGYPVHRYCHTLLIGAVVGVAWGLAAYPLRSVFKRLMDLIRIPYRTGLRKMLISGMLGVWLHVLIDGVYHYDVRLFWPSKSISLWRITQRRLGKEQIETLCLCFLLAAAALYVLGVIAFLREKRAQNQTPAK
jgi:membrane-bound metal-dependent hydrolase YbcI (DUF457 family)